MMPLMAMTSTSEATANAGKAEAYESSARDSRRLSQATPASESNNAAIA